VAAARLVADSLCRRRAESTAASSPLVSTDEPRAHAHRLPATPDSTPFSRQPPWPVAAAPEE
jgi:hypothetical protein